MEAAMQVLMVTSGESNLFYFTVIISILFYFIYWKKTQDMVVIIYLFCAKAFFLSRAPTSLDL
jgi:hypothetical protein